MKLTLVMMALLLGLSSSIAFGACGMKAGDTYLVDKQVNVIRIQNEKAGDQLKISGRKNFKLMVLGSFSWGCRVKIIPDHQNGSTFEGMISDKMLAKLRTVTPTSTALSVEEMSDTIKGINEAKPVNPVKREDCPDVTSTVPVPRPKPRPANLGGANSGIRVPIPTPRPKPRPANLGTSSTAAKSVAGLSASKKGLDLIAEMEGSAPYFYSDHGIPAIGNGVQINSEKELRQLCRNFKLNCAVAKQSWLRIKRGQRADKKKLLSKSQIRTLLKQKIVRYENTVKKVFRGTGVDLNQNQFDALVSLAFNYPRAFKDPRLRIYKAMKAGRLNDVALEMGDIGPKQGHYKRRLREINLFLLGVASIDPRKMPSNAPSDPEHRKVYKKLKKFWISRAGKGRTFWQSNPEYRFFMKRF